MKSAYLTGQYVLHNTTFCEKHSFLNKKLVTLEFCGFNLEIATTLKKQSYIEMLGHQQLSKILLMLLIDSHFRFCLAEQHVANRHIKAMTVDKTTGGRRTVQLVVMSLSLRQDVSSLDAFMRRNGSYKYLPKSTRNKATCVPTVGEISWKGKIILFYWYERDRRSWYK